MRISDWSSDLCSSDLATAMTASWTTLVDARTLAAALERADLVILDCPFSLAAPDAGQAAYAASHLPGAPYAHLDRVLSDHPNPRGAHTPWPAPRPARPPCGQTSPIHMQTR